MSESYPPNGDQVPEVPAEQPPIAPEVPIAPEPAAFSVGQPPSVPSLEPGQKPPKKKIDWVFFVLGLLAPSVVLLIAGGLINWFSTIGAAVSLVGGLGGLLQLAVVGGAIAAYVVGNRTGNNRWRSFGIGALWSYIVYMLVALLAFGACLISLGSGGNFLGN
ncbi:MAG TPA: hypothetical protein VFG89_07830 [Coriobacteriia bacterium]|nr:hypothetical protein [Coriobacteriia bacterium]